MAGERLTWALLAPVGQERLDALAREYWREEVTEDENDYATEGWEVVGGTQDHSAVLDRNPGSEYTHDAPLAERISRELGRPVYVLYLNEMFADGDAVFVYEGGRQTGARPLPYDLARSLGVTLPGDEGVVFATGPRPVRGVIVVEGVNAADVARALDMNEPPRGPVHILDGPAGAFMYNEVSEHIPPVTRRLSREFPETNVYTLARDRHEKRFTVRVTRGGNDVGAFEWPAPAEQGSLPGLDSVMGETSPEAIAAALGIPPALMDLREHSESNRK